MIPIGSFPLKLGRKFDCNSSFSSVSTCTRNLRVSKDIILCSYVICLFDASSGFSHRWLTVSDVDSGISEGVISCNVAVFIPSE